ncbi:D-2-hydroxyacid dehydrogenase [Roseiarcaceae bacterium H3SJ34-1]|uniref:D-2-hydroxyacid dehydrogenase n=1 Tax=Terripilifer ovatus TaxID=3032367 RepID=UPI003AB92889|nr:D-2-hydroxyacid dehydrogenase [Roseiarcaceae bacterium H3SJ34-1]
MQIVVFTPNQIIQRRLSDTLGASLRIANDEAGVFKALPAADGLIMAVQDYSDQIGRAVLQAGRLKWVQLLSAGFDRVQKHGVPQGVIVTNAGDALTPSVATHAVSLALAVQRGFPAMAQAQARGEWARDMQPRMTTPAEATCLIVGFGSIGKEVARLMRAFGAHIVGVSRSGKTDPLASPLADEIITPAQLPDYLPRADTIVLAVPLDDSTRGLIGRQELSLCKKSAVIVNIARGGVIDTDALADALEAGTIGGAGLDVTDPEPLTPGHRLWKAPNLLISPHVAAACGPLLYKRIADVACANAGRFMRGEALQNVVIS